PEQFDAVRAPQGWLEKRGLADAGKEYLANMGVYLCRREVLLELLRARPEALDLVTQLIARILKSHRLQAHLFTDYWQDLGASVRRYPEAPPPLASARPPFDSHPPEGVIYTHMRALPAARILATEVEQSLISDGCVVEEGARLERCVVGQRLRIGRGA